MIKPIRLIHRIRIHRIYRIQEHHQEHHQERHQEDRQEDPQDRHEDLLQVMLTHHTTIAIDERAADEITRLTLRSLKCHRLMEIQKMTRRRNAIELECNNFHTDNNRTLFKWYLAFLLKSRLSSEEVSC